MDNLSTLMRSISPSAAKILLWLLLADSTTRHRNIDQPAVQDGTHLTPPTIKKGLKELTDFSLIFWKSGGYHVNKKIFHPQKSFFTMYDDDECTVLELEHHQSNSEKIFSSMKDLQGRTLSGPPLKWLGENISETTAQAWAKWLLNAPKEYKNPLGFMIRCLQTNKEQYPPFEVVVKKASWLDNYPEEFIIK